MIDRRTGSRWPLPGLLPTLDRTWEIPAGRGRVLVVTTVLSLCYRSEALVQEEKRERYVDGD